MAVAVVTSIAATWVVLFLLGGPVNFMIIAGLVLGLVVIIATPSSIRRTSSGGSLPGIRRVRYRRGGSSSP